MANGRDHPSPAALQVPFSHTFAKGPQPRSGAVAAGLKSWTVATDSTR